jgi:N utilization substance protein B
MAARHTSRRRALQVLFNWDMRRESIDAAIAHYYSTLHSDNPETEGALEEDSFMEELVRGTIAKLPEIDKRIEEKAVRWRLERMPSVDRNIIRLATYELLKADTPAPIVIDEAVDLARQFSGDESLAFVNGILDAISKQESRSQHQGLSDG